MLSFDEQYNLIRQSCRHGEATLLENTSPRGIRIPAEDLHSVSHELLYNPSLCYDMLSCITGIDNGPDMGTMEVVYTVYSIPFNTSLMIYVELPRDNSEVDSVSDIWKTANWHEREAYDMFGIRFRNHPDLRRILLPADWEGYPLRKDYQHQERYRNIKVEY